jgi:hypothetical protein
MVMAENAKSGGVYGFHGDDAMPKAVTAMMR